jgi:quinol monooxygenase YgiN
MEDNAHRQHHASRDLQRVHPKEKKETMAHTALLHVTAKPGRGPEVISYYQATLAATRSRPGLIGLRVVRNEEDENKFMLIEQWDSKADQTAYAEWRATTPEVMAEFGDMIDSFSLDWWEEVNA